MSGKKQIQMSGKKIKDGKFDIRISRYGMANQQDNVIRIGKGFKRHQRSKGLVYSWQFWIALTLIPGLIVPAIKYGVQYKIDPSVLHMVVDSLSGIMAVVGTIALGIASAGLVYVVCVLGYAWLKNHGIKSRLDRIQ